MRTVTKPSEHAFGDSLLLGLLMCCAGKAAGHEARAHVARRCVGCALLSKALCVVTKQALCVQREAMLYVYVTKQVLMRAPRSDAVGKRAQMLAESKVLHDPARRQLSWLAVAVGRGGRT
eukprot:6198639-Pleurochrysis_carterae.AAC.3